MLLVLSLFALEHLFNPVTVNPYPEAHRNIVFKEIGGESLRLDVFQPVNQTEPTPAVVYVHGGGWFLRDRDDFEDFAMGLGIQGYAGVTIDFRDLPPNGFYDQIADIKDAIRWVRLNAEQYNIDPDRIGITGASSGAHLAALALTAGDGEGFGDDPEGTSSELQGAVLFEGIYDLLDEHTKVLNLLFWYFSGGPRLFEAPNAYYIFSPLYKIDGSEPPSMMIYGRDDKVVPKGQPETFAAILRANGVPAVAVPHPGGHGFNQFQIWSRPEQMALALSWWERTLR